jgi:hypothetical protein
MAAIRSLQRRQVVTGFYVVRLNLTSGNRQEKVVELTAGEDTSVD